MHIEKKTVYQLKKESKDSIEEANANFKIPIFQSDDQSESKTNPKYKWDNI